MLLTTLIPVLALLASPSLARTEHPNAAHAGRRAAAHREHARNVEKMTEVVERREALAATNPRALAQAPRIKKRGAQGCRAKGSNFTSSATDAAAPTASVTSAVVVSSTTTSDASSTTSPAFAADVYSPSVSKDYLQKFRSDVDAERDDLKLRRSGCFLHFGLLQLQWW